jgi:chromosome segregation ATPase
MNLYELGDAFQTIQRILDDPTADEAEIESALTLVDDVKGELDAKVDAICRVVFGIEGDVAKLKKEEERLKKRRQALENRQARLREWVRATMSVLDIDKIKTSLFTVSLAKAKARLVVVDESLIPDEFKKTVVEIRKADMNTAFRTMGLIPAGTEVVMGDPELRIR